MCLQGGEGWAAGKLGTDQIPGRQTLAESNPMGRARAALALTACPKTLPCRDKERGELMRFVEASVTPGEAAAGKLRGSCMKLQLHMHEAACMCCRASSAVIINMCACGFMVSCLNRGA